MKLIESNQHVNKWLSRPSRTRGLKPADELTKIVTEAYRENSYPHGKLNVDYDTWHDLLNGGQMALYPDVRPDTLYILSAQNNSLGLWRVL